MEPNLDSVMHLHELARRDLKTMRARIDLSSRVISGVTEQLKTAANPGQAKLARSLNRLPSLLDSVSVSANRFHRIMLWQVVMMVTCCEAYLHDVLASAAGIDPQLMINSEQRALYADVIAATSLDDLANGLRARWARSWLDQTGPSGWISRLGKMGARGYPDGLGLRLERFWGIRHVVVHAAGVATADFVKRHPGVVGKAGDRVQLTPNDFTSFVTAVVDFIQATDKFFLSRYPSMLAVLPAYTNKKPI